MIAKRGGKYCLLTKDGKKTLGCHSSRAKARRQERAIQHSKYACLRVSARAQVRRVGGFVTFPVVALVEGVIHASNAEQPELVLAEDFRIGIERWNGMPVFLDHPKDREGRALDGQRGKQQSTPLGAVFNPRFTAAEELTMDVWMREEGMPREAAELVRRVEAGEPVDVSVGVKVAARPKTGMHKGKKYYKRWMYIRPDHLALLPEGVAGACSYEMGCGVRAAKESKMSLTLSEKIADMWTSLKELVARLPEEEREAAGARHSAADQTMLQTIHDQAVHLGAACVGGVGAPAVKSYSAEQGTTYMTAVGKLPEAVRTAAAPSLQQCMDTIIPQLEAEGVTIDDPEAFCAWWKDEHAALSATAEPRAACACGGSKMTKAERIAALVERKGETFKPFLETLSEVQLEQLQGMEEDEEDEEEEDEDKKPYKKARKATAAAEPPTPAPVPLSEEEWMKQAPPNVRELVARQRAADEARRTELMTELKDNSVYSEDELKTMSLTDLEKISKLVQAAAAKARPVDYSPRAPRKQDDPNAIPKPPSLEDKILTSRGLKKPA